MDDANKVMVKPVRGFLGEEGDVVAGGPAFAVSRQRAADLKANGLVEVLAEEKAAPAHANKKAAEPENKAAQAHDDKSSGRRGRGD
jgi:hypothetical protein